MILTPTAVPHELDFVSPLLGLHPVTRYTAEPLDDAGAIFTLRSTPAEDRQVRLFLADPAAFFPDYAPRLPAGTHALLGAEDTAALVVLVVVHPAAEEQHPPTANLAAPVVLDPATGRAAQVILDEDQPLRAPFG